MPKKSKLYVDDKGVMRGYYVYLHRDRATGRVFYVGKGCGDRAWNTSERNDEWKDHVSTLNKGWEVILAHQDLSEMEALELEEQLVEANGGAGSQGGTLTNWFPGGEHPEAVRFEFGIEIPDDGYDETRQFKTLARATQEEFAKRIRKELLPVAKKLDELIEEADRTGDHKLDSSVTDLEPIVGDFMDYLSDFERRRISWKDLALSLEEFFDDSESEFKEIAKYDRRVRPLVERTYKVARDYLAEIDTGNREEAEEAARRARSSEGTHEA